MTKNKQLGARIKAHRMQKGLTLKQLSERVDLSVGFLSQAERGLAAISLNSLYRLATEFGVDVKDFFDSPDDIFRISAGGNPDQHIPRPAQSLHLPGKNFFVSVIISNGS